MLDESFKFQDNQMDKHSLLEVIKVIENIKDKIKPKIIFTHHASDLNIDHTFSKKWKSKI